MDIAHLQQFAVGEYVDIDDGIVGEVVINATRDEWSVEFPKDTHPRPNYDGILIRQSKGALVFHPTDYFTNHAGRIKRHAERT